MATENYPQEFPLELKAGSTTVEVGLAVKLDGTGYGVVPCGAGEKSVGVSLGTVSAVGDDVRVLAGPAVGIGISGAAFSAGVGLSADAAGKYVLATTGDVLAYALSATTGADQRASILVLGPAIEGYGIGVTAADLTENSGAIGGSSDGNLPDLTATAATITGTQTGSTNGVVEDVAATAASTAGT